MHPNIPSRGAASPELAKKAHDVWCQSAKAHGIDVSGLGADSDYLQRLAWASSQGWRHWVRAGGPTDPRSKSPHMTYVSYRRMLSNPAYIARWA
jgi:hypothetical protein